MDNEDDKPVTSDNGWSTEGERRIRGYVLRTRIFYDLAIFYDIVPTVSEVSE